VKGMGDMNKNNSTATILNSIAVLIFITGFFFGFFRGVALGSYVVILYFWLIAFIIGILFISLSEIISLLQKLVNNTTKALSNDQSINHPSNINLPWEDKENN
jgi:hypothetical protein